MLKVALAKFCFENIILLFFTKTSFIEIWTEQLQNGFLLKGGKFILVSSECIYCTPLFWVSLTSGKDPHLFIELTMALLRLEPWLTAE